MLACLPASVANLVGEQVIAGLILVIQKSGDIIRSFLFIFGQKRSLIDVFRSQTEWNLVFALIRSTMVHPEAARMSFDLIDGLTAEGPDHSLSVDNFLGLLTILDDFATAASTLQEQQLHKRRRAEPLSSSKYVNKLGCKSVVVDTNWHLVAHR